MGQDTAGPRRPARRRQERRIDGPRTSPPDAGAIADPPDRDSPFADNAPLIVEHGLYCREQLLRMLGISKATLSDWQMAGLQALSKGMRRRFYHGRDVIDFLKRAD